MTFPAPAWSSVTASPSSDAMSHNNPIHSDLFGYMRNRDAPHKSPAMRIFHLEDVVTDFVKLHKLGYIDTAKAVSAYLAHQQAAA